MSKRSIDVLLEDMLDAIQKIERYTNGMSQDIFEEDEKTVDAVIRNLEIIGEAANRFPFLYVIQNLNPSPYFIHGLIF